MLQCVPQVSEGQNEVVTRVGRALVVQEVDLLHMRTDAAQMVFPLRGNLDKVLDVKENQDALYDKEPAYHESDL